MRSGSKSGPRPTTALVWGSIAEIGLGVVLLLVLISPGGRATFGSGLSVAVLIAAALLTPAAMAAVVSAQLARGIRWGVAVLLALAAGGVGVVVITALAAGPDASAAGAGLLLIVAVIGMYVLAVDLPRARVSRKPDVGDERGR